jgi:hypothetical protein
MRVDVPMPTLLLTASPLEGAGAELLDWDPAYDPTATPPFEPTVITGVIEFEFAGVVEKSMPVGFVTDLS